jgi:hypothetical protein
VAPNVRMRGPPSGGARGPVAERSAPSVVAGLARDHRWRVDAALEDAYGVRGQRPALRGEVVVAPSPLRGSAPLRNRGELPQKNTPDRREQRYARAVDPTDQVDQWRIAASRQAPSVRRMTRIRLVDADGETIGIIWTHAEADDDHIRSLIPDGVKAMVARNVWPQ